MRELSYRLMTPADVPAALEMRPRTRENAVTTQELLEVYGITREVVVAALGQDARGWVAEANGELVGFAMGNRTSGEVTVLALLPEFEGLGAGRALLDRVTRWLFDEGFEQIWLSANRDPGVRSHGFYRHLGWRRHADAPRGEEILVLDRTRHS